MYDSSYIFAFFATFLFIDRYSPFCHYKTKLIIIGAKKTVKIPAITIDKLLIAASISPNSIALAVPIAWALLPKARPLATGWSM